jgi:hypothetical protein
MINCAFKVFFSFAGAFLYAPGQLILLAFVILQVVLHQACDFLLQFSFGNVPSSNRGKRGHIESTPLQASCRPISRGCFNPKMRCLTGIDFLAKKIEQSKIVHIALIGGGELQFALFLAALRAVIDSKNRVFFEKRGCCRTARCQLGVQRWVAGSRSGLNGISPPFALENLFIECQNDL